jgi:hypothetical protein
MKDDPYQKPFRWSYELALIVIAIIFIILLCVLLATPALPTLPTNLIRDL